MKKLTLLLIILTLVFSACTKQMTDEEILARAEEIQSEQATDAPEVTTEPTAEPTTEPTPEPTATPEPKTEIVRHNTEPFENYYTELESNEHITDEHWTILRDMFDTYDIVMKFDDSYANGRYEDSFVRLSDENIANVIKIFNDTLDILNPSKTETTSYAVGSCIHTVYTVDSFFHAGAAIGREIQVSAGIDYKNDTIMMNYVSEWANLFIGYNHIPLIEFESYNEFPDYERTLSEGDEHFINDVIRPLESVDDEKLLETLWDAGLLKYDGYKNLDDDVAQYLEGIFLNEGDFWRVYAWSYFGDDNQTIFNKANAIMNEIGKVNQEWNLKELYIEFCPYGIKDFNPDDYVEE